MVIKNFPLLRDRVSCLIYLFKTVWYFLRKWGCDIFSKKGFTPPKWIPLSAPYKVVEATFQEVGAELTPDKKYDTFASAYQCISFTTKKSFYGFSIAYLSSRHRQGNTS